MRTSTVRDGHCCALSWQRVKYQLGARKVNQTTHTPNPEKEEFGVYWLIYQQHISLHGRASRKTISHIFKQQSLHLCRAVLAE